MSAEPVFRAQLSGRPETALEIRSATLLLAEEEDGGFKAGFQLEATQPGMTLDDRGVADWDAPVVLMVEGGRVGAPKANGGLAPFQRPAGPIRADDGFFYYWDHTQFTELDWHLTAPGGGAYAVDVACVSSEGHRVRAAAPLTLTGLIRNADGTVTDAMAEALFGHGLEGLKQRDLPGGRVSLSVPRRRT